MGQENSKAARRLQHLLRSLQDSEVPFTDLSPADRQLIASQLAMKRSGSTLTNASLNSATAAAVVASIACEVSTVAREKLAQDEDFMQSLALSIVISCGPLCRKLCEDRFVDGAGFDSKVGGRISSAENHRVVSDVFGVLHSGNIAVRDDQRKHKQVRAWDEEERANLRRILATAARETSNFGTKKGSSMLSNSSSNSLKSTPDDPSATKRKRSKLGLKVASSSSTVGSPKVRTTILRKQVSANVSPISKKHGTWQPGDVSRVASGQSSKEQTKGPSRARSRALLIACLTALGNVALDQSHAQALAAELGLVRVLICVISFRDSEVQRWALNALGILCIEHERNQTTVALFGGIRVLSHLITPSRNVDIIHWALFALYSAATNSLNARALISRRSTVARLVALLKAATDEDERLWITCILGDLAATDYRTQGILGRQALPVLVNFLGPRLPEHQVFHTCCAIRGLCAKHPRNQEQAAKLGTLIALCDVHDRFAALGSSETSMAAVDALEDMTTQLDPVKHVPARAKRLIRSEVARLYHFTGLSEDAPPALPSAPPPSLYGRSDGCPSAPEDMPPPLPSAPPPSLLGRPQDLVEETPSRLSVASSSPQRRLQVSLYGASRETGKNSPSPQKSFLSLAMRSNDACDLLTELGMALPRPSGQSQEGRSLTSPTGRQLRARSSMTNLLAGKVDDSSTSSTSESENDIVPPEQEEQIETSAGPIKLRPGLTRQRSLWDDLDLAQSSESDSEGDTARVDIRSAGGGEAVIAPRNKTFHFENDSTRSPDISFDGSILDEATFARLTRKKENLLVPFDELEVLNDGEAVGTGAFANVYQANFRGKEVAVKELIPAEDAIADATNAKLVLREVYLLQKVGHHPNIIGLTGVTVHESGLYIVTDFVTGKDLFKLLMSHMKPRMMNDADINVLHFSWRRRLDIASDICRAMKYLHGHDILLRDLKSSNVLVLEHAFTPDVHAEPVSARLCDFGFARQTHLRSFPSDIDRNMTMHIGTEVYMAPEVQFSTEYSFAADVFTFGNVLFELCTCDTPPSRQPIAFHFDMPDFERLIRQGRAVGADGGFCGPPEDLIRLACACVAGKPDHRPSFIQVAAALRQLRILGDKV